MLPEIIRYSELKANFDNLYGKALKQVNLCKLVVFKCVFLEIMKHFTGLDVRKTMPRSIYGRSVFIFILVKSKESQVE